MKNYPNLTGSDWKYAGDNGTATIKQIEEKVTIELKWNLEKKDTYTIVGRISEKAPGLYVIEGYWDKGGFAPGYEGNVEASVVTDDTIKIGNITGELNPPTNLSGLILYRNRSVDPELFGKST